MTAEEREELGHAIEHDLIVNATSFAKEFAEARGLNPTTVRSAISRLRRERGMLTRRPGRGSGTVPALDRLVERVMAAPADDEVIARIGAAALVRYAEDPDFRRAVDPHRATVEQAYGFIKSFQERAPWLFDSHGRMIPHRRPDVEEE